MSSGRVKSKNGACVPFFRNNRETWLVTIYCSSCDKNCTSDFDNNQIAFSVEEFFIWNFNRVLENHMCFATLARISSYKWSRNGWRKFQFGYLKGWGHFMVHSEEFLRSKKDGTQVFSRVHNASNINLDWSNIIKYKFVDKQIETRWSNWPGKAPSNLIHVLQFADFYANFQLRGCKTQVVLQETLNYIPVMTCTHIPNKVCYKVNRPILKATKVSSWRLISEMKWDRQ